MSRYESDAPTGTMIGVFLTGIALGTIATFLLSPQSGRESRDQLREYVRRRGEDLSDFQDKTLETYHDMSSGTRQGLQDIQSTIKDALQAGLEEFRKEWKQARKT